MGWKVNPTNDLDQWKEGSTGGWFHSTTGILTEEEGVGLSTVRRLGWNKRYGKVNGGEGGRWEVKWGGVLRLSEVRWVVRHAPVGKLFGNRGGWGTEAWVLTNDLFVRVGWDTSGWGGGPWRSTHH
eukprot:687332-Hanusia_phi.AAC.3